MAAGYYQEKKKDFTKRLLKGIKIFLNKKKQKSSICLQMK